MRRVVALVTALLLALCVASPAIAEIGCSWDTATHVAEVGHDGAGAGHGEDGMAGDRGNIGGGMGGDLGDDMGDDGDRDSHCAFSHGHGDLATVSAAPTVPRRATCFAPPIAAAFVSSLLSGLDRPPRA